MTHVRFCAWPGGMPHDCLSDLGHVHARPHCARAHLWRTTSPHAPHRTAPQVFDPRRPNVVSMRGTVHPSTDGGRLDVRTLEAAARCVGKADGEADGEAEAACVPRQQKEVRTALERVEYCEYPKYRSERVRASHRRASAVPRQQAEGTALARRSRTFPAPFSVWRPPLGVQNSAAWRPTDDGDP